MLLSYALERIERCDAVLTSDRCSAWRFHTGPERTRVSLTLEDRLAITELVLLHGHLVDDGSLDRLEELFTADVVYDLTDFGQELLSGVAAIREAAWALGAANPVAHHVTSYRLGALSASWSPLWISGVDRCGSSILEDFSPSRNAMRRYMYEWTEEDSPFPSRALMGFQSAGVMSA
ncbi:nuclear transport factor 2 family protein [Streptomyces spiralis]